VTRRGLGRGRLLVAIGSVVVLAGMVLPWFRRGGVFGLPAIEGNGFDGSGIAIFVAAVALLAVICLPYASRDGRSGLDRAASFLVLAGVALAAFAIRLVQLANDQSLALPDRAPGLYVTGAGLLLVAWGVAEILAEPAPLR
jgi:hypothetical protein